MDPIYKIIGGDGREYGPVDLFELRSWIGDGRVSPLTLVWNQEDGQWITAENRPELVTEIQKIAPPIVERVVIVAGFLPRLVAFIVDLLIVSFIATAIAAALGWPEMKLPSEPKLAEIPGLLRGMLPEIILRLSVNFLYSVLFNARFGATPGKMALGMRILRIDGREISFGIAVGRWFAARLSELIVYVGYFMVLFRQDKRGLHDLLAGTRVVFYR
jgi:uncharacterized RDD family membrane protein YckC